MKSLFSKFLPGVLIACSMVSISVGQSVVINSSAPDTTAAVSADFDDATQVFSRIFTEAANSNHARGQILTLEPGATEIASLTIHKSSDQTFDGDTLRLQIFEGTNDGFGFGFGHTTANNGDDFFVDTSADVNNFPDSGPIVPFFDETFELDGLIENDTFVTLNFSAPVSVAGITDLGFLLVFDTGEADPDLTFFQYFENGNGNRIQVTTTAHGTGSSRLFQHALLSTVVESEAEFVLGDVDLSGDVDFDDIGPFIERLSGGFQAEADINGDGLVDFGDIAGFIGILGAS